MKKHQLVEAAVAERETVGQLRLALRELRHEEEELQPGRKKLLPPGWKRYRVEEIKELALERNMSTSGNDGKPLVKEALIRDMFALVRETDRNRNGAARSMIGGRADHHGRLDQSRAGCIPGDADGDADW